MKFTLIFSALLIIVQAFNPAFGQVANSEPYLLPSSDSGEVASSLLDKMIIEAKQSGERIFVIARLGSDEQHIRLNFLRYSAAREYFSIRVPNLDTIVYAEGERVKGEGRIEFYLGSKLQFVTLAPRNGMPKLDCCPDYMPPTKRKPNRKKRTS